MTEPTARNGSFVGRPSIDRMTVSVVPPSVPALLKNVREALEAGILEETRFCSVEGGKRRDYILPALGLEFCVKTWPRTDSCPRSAVVEVYDLLRTSDEAAFIDVVLGEIAGTPDVTLSEIETTVDLIPLGCTVKDVWNEVTPGAVMSRARGVPVSYLSFRDSGRTTLKLASDGFDDRSDSFFTVYLTPKDGEARAVRVEKTWKRAALVGDPRWENYLNLAVPVPVGRFRPLRELSYRVLDEDLLRRRLLNLERKRGRLSPVAARLKVRVLIDNLKFGNPSWDLPILAEYEGERAARRALKKGEDPEAARAERVERLMRPWRERRRGWYGMYESALERWREPGKRELCLAAIYGRAKLVLKRYGIADPTYFFARDGSKKAQIEAGKLA